MRMRARLSSHIFFTSSPLRPIMLPTLRTGTTKRKTLSPGQPGHLGGDADAVDSACCSIEAAAASPLLLLPADSGSFEATSTADGGGDFGA